MCTCCGIITCDQLDCINVPLIVLIDLYKQYDLK